MTLTIPDAVITGSIALSAKRRYLSYSEADFEVFAPQRRHVAPIGVKFGTEDTKLHPYRCKDKGKTEIFLLRFAQNVNINATQGRMPCAIFT